MELALTPSVQALLLARFQFQRRLQTQCLCSRVRMEGGAGGGWQLPFLLLPPKVSDVQDAQIKLPAV